MRVVLNKRYINGLLFYGLRVLEYVLFHLLSLNYLQLNSIKM